MNTELISKVLKRIEKDHKHFYMEWFRNRLTKKDLKNYNNSIKLDCGTVCCFAGEIVIEALGPGALFKLPWGSIPEVAATIAGLTADDQQNLFYTRSDSAYGGCIRHVPGTKAYAKYVTGCIREYLAKKGYTV